MPTQNRFPALVALGTLCAVVAFAHAADAESTPTEEGKKLLRLIAEAKKAKSYRPLTDSEIKRALALPVDDRTAVFLANPGFQLTARLPSGVTFERDGYYILVTAGKTSYSFLQAQTPVGKEVLFACGKGLPWWGWVEVPGVCGVAVIDVPMDRAAQLEQASRLAGIDMDMGYSDMNTPEGRAFFLKIKPQFELVLRRCQELAHPGDIYGWAGRISRKGKVVRTGMRLLVPMNGTYVRKSSYFDCINKEVKTIQFPPPPDDPGAVLWLGGYPMTVNWKHHNTGDEIKMVLN